MEEVRLGAGCADRRARSANAPEQGVDGAGSKRVKPHGRAVFFLPYEAALDQRITQSIGLLYVQKPSGVLALYEA
jgi:hypothetical protein